MNEITAITLVPADVRQFSTYRDQLRCEVSLCTHVIDSKAASVANLVTFSPNVLTFEILLMTYFTVK